MQPPLRKRRDYIVALQDFPGEDVYRKLARLRIGTDASIYITVPYHPAQDGWLLKVDARPPIERPDDALGVRDAPVVEQAYVDVPVKMSVHPSGFVQFSSNSASTIRSGVAPMHVPKGLGLHAHPFTDPVRTGPTFGITFFEYGECDDVDGSEKVEVIRFGQRDLLQADEHDLQGQHVVSVVGYVFPKSVRRDVSPGRPGWVRRWYSPHRPDWRMWFRIIDLPTTLACLGIAIIQQHAPKERVDSGYVMGSPKDLTHRYVLAGMFPAGDAAVPPSVPIGGIGGDPLG